jgi:GTPase
MESDETIRIATSFPTDDALSIPLYNKTDAHLEWLPPEIEQGNVEYKLHLVDLPEATLSHRVTQLNWRLNEGMGEAVYRLGVHDNGRPVGISKQHLQKSISTLRIMAERLNCSIEIEDMSYGEYGQTASVVVRRLGRVDIQPVHVQVAVVGSHSTGKSTLVGVLARGTLDNGHGLARSQVFRHFHEIESGRTSCISPNIMCFDHVGRLLGDNVGTISPTIHTKSSNNNNNSSTSGCRSDNSQDLGMSRLRSFSESELADRTRRLVTLLDLAGHEKYLKTTLHGMIGRAPDLCMIAIHPCLPIQSMTKEHLAVAIALDMPICIVCTHSDRVSDEGIQQAITMISKLLNGVGRSSMCINNKYDITSCLWGMDYSEGKRKEGEGEGEGEGEEGEFKSTSPPSPHQRERERREVAFGKHTSTGAGVGAINYTRVPIFVVSSVTGYGIELLRHFLFILPAHSISWENRRQENVEVRVLEVFDVNEQDPVNMNVGYGSGSGSGSGMSVSRSGKLIVEDECRRSSREDNAMMMDKHGIPLRPLSFAERELGGNHHPRERSHDRDRSCSLVDDTEIVPNTDTTTAIDTVAHHGHEEEEEEEEETSSVIIHGRIESGKVCIDDILHLGPCPIGTYREAVVTSLRVNNVPVRRTVAGQCATLVVDVRSHVIVALSLPVPLPPTPTHISSPGSIVLGRKRGEGLVLLDTTTPTQAYIEFEADILLFNHPNAVCVGYQPVVHSKCIRQSAVLIAIHLLEFDGKEKSGELPSQKEAETSTSFSSGQNARCRFRFLYRPEYLQVGNSIVLREGQTRGVGTVLSVGH